MRKKIIFLKLHSQDTFFPGLGSLGNTFPSPSKALDLSMFYDTEMPNLIILQINGKENFVPITNVQTGTFAPEEKLTIKK
jgi:hypothetical protein